LLPPATRRPTCFATQESGHKNTLFFAARDAPSTTAPAPPGWCPSHDGSHTGGASNEPTTPLATATCTVTFPGSGGPCTPMAAVCPHTISRASSNLTGHMGSFPDRRRASSPWDLATGGGPATVPPRDATGGGPTPPRRDQRWPWPIRDAIGGGLAPPHCEPATIDIRVPL
jgi:hypothetical protein